MSGILEPTTDLGKFSDRIPYRAFLHGLDAFLECSGAPNEPLSRYHGNCRFGILRCSFDLEHCVVLEFLQKKLTDGIDFF